MKNTIIVLVCLGAASANAAVNFDRVIDVKSIVEQAGTPPAAIPAARFNTVTDITRDCKKITFGPQDQLTSALVPLSSQETGQDCTNTGTPAGQICFPTFQTYRANAQIVITQPRTLQPGQNEVFEVCLWGQFLSLKPVSTPYKYSVNQVMDVFQLTPVPAAPAKDVDRSAQDVCTLAMDSNYSCVYQCKDGSYVSKPNFYGPPPFPGMDFPFHGCAPTAQNSPLINITK